MLSLRVLVGSRREIRLLLLLFFFLFLFLFAPGATDPPPLAIHPPSPHTTKTPLTRPGYCGLCG